MIIELPSGDKAKLIGDPHLGRRFETGVPLHRRGEREKKQWKNFHDQLNTAGVDYIIMVGDLFDHPHVGYATVTKAAAYVMGAADRNPDTTYLMLAGNHDLSRTVGVVGAWETFCRIIDDRLPNLEAITQPCCYGELVLLPWQWDTTAQDQLALANIEKPSVIAIGHWDLKSYGGDDSHLCPTKALKALGVEAIYSGHYHTPGPYIVDGVEVICTGSMEPYSHGEDPDEQIYVTRSLVEVAANPEAFRDKHVRVVLKAGEELPELDCLALTAIRDTEATESAVLETSLASFDWKAVIKRELSDVDPEVVTFIEERLNA